MKLKWYTIHMRPWGQSIGHYYTAYYKTKDGRTEKINRFITKSGRTKFYVLNRGSDILRFRKLSTCLRRAEDPSRLPPAYCLGQSVPAII